MRTTFATAIRERRGVIVGALAASVLLLSSMTAGTATAGARPTAQG
jgi:hypothetical protein